MIEPEWEYFPGGCRRMPEKREVGAADFALGADYDGSLELECLNCGRYYDRRDFEHGATIADYLVLIVEHRCGGLYRSEHYEAPMEVTS